jgi:hypothetical protein
MPPEETQEVVTDPPPGGEPEPTTGEEGQVLEGQAPESTDAPAGDDAGAVHAKAEALAKRMAQKRIRQLTRKARDAEQGTAALQERLDALEKRIGPDPEPERPTSADFETLEEYEDARDIWRDEVKARKATSEAPAVAPSPEQVARAESADRIEEGLAALGDEYPDAVDVVMNDDWPCSTDMYDFIEASDSGPALAYYLATNEELAGKIAGLSPVLAARELVRVEAGLPATTPKPSASPPPPPGTPVSPSAASVVTDPDKLTSAQWKEWRLGEMAKRA